MAYGTMGGDGQPQTQAMVFSRYVLFRQPLPEAIEAPRWLLGRTWGSTHTNLRMESRFDGNLIDRLLSAGHDVEVIPDALFRYDGPCRRRGAASGWHAWKVRMIRAPIRAHTGSDVATPASFPPRSVILSPATRFEAGNP